MTAARTVRRTTVAAESVFSETRFAPTEYYVQLGRRIAARREGLRMSQQQLADLLSYSRPSVANMEAGRQQVHVHMLEKLAVALRCSPLWLMQWAGREGLAK